MSYQYGIFDECFVDSFAGGGGASTGIELATGHPVDVAINHDEAAIMMHRRNHPYTEHYREDIWQVDPVDAVRGRHVRLAWFSPDCKHFSRAKGAALVDKKIRGLAWVVLKWAAKVRPDVIFLENVPEFVTWGPVRKGKPVKSKSGQTYRKWLAQLEALGYTVESRKICAADLGAPTIRTRFHLIARCDGKPIVWPERTHAPRDSEEVKSGKLLPWKSAAEIIDFSLPCPSIFASKKEIKDQYGVNAMRPLKENTLRRIARGLDKFVIKSGEPFIVPVGYGENKGQKPRIHDMKEPLSTVVSSTKQYVCDPLMTPYVICNNAGNAPHGMDDPVPTVTTGGRNILSAAYLSEYYGNAREGIDLRDPAQTVTAKDRECLNAAWLTQYFSGEGHYHSVDEPLATITTMEREGVTLAHLAHFKGKDKGQHLNDPMMTVTARDGQFADVRTTVVKWDGQTDLGYWDEVRKMLNSYCGYSIAEDEILLLNIRGCWYFISDIGLRMLTPRELYDAMGFPHDYIIDRDINGNPISRADQVARCGNAVCPAVAEALVRANLPECCKNRIADMQELHRVMTG
jgi:DNA (cytosine-5)-methyltransferase 1